MTSTIVRNKLVSYQNKSFLNFLIDFILLGHGLEFTTTEMPKVTKGTSDVSLTRKRFPLKAGTKGNLTTGARVVKTVPNSTVSANQKDGTTSLAPDPNHLSANTQKPMVAVVLKAKKMMNKIMELKAKKMMNKIMELKGKKMMNKIMNLEKKPQKKPKRVPKALNQKQENATNLSTRRETSTMLRNFAKNGVDTWRALDQLRKMKPFMPLPNEGKRLCK